MSRQPVQQALLLLRNHGILRDALRTPSVGIIETDAERGLVRYAKPAGVIASIVPTWAPGRVKSSADGVCVVSDSASWVSRSVTSWTLGWPARASLAAKLSVIVVQTIAAAPNRAQ